MRVKVLRVWPDTKQTNKGTIWGAQCTWEGHEDTRVSFFFQPQPGEYEVPKVEPRQYEGKEYYTIRQGQVVTAPQAAPSDASPVGAAWIDANARTNQNPVNGYPARAYLALDNAIGKQVESYGDNAGPLKETIYGCMWITMSKDPVVMAEMDEEGARGGASSSGDELPRDEEITL